MARGDGSLRIDLADDLSPLREVVFSGDATEWQATEAADGLLDGRRETIVLTPDDGTGLLLLRVTDAAFNVITFDLSSHLR